MEKQTLLVMEGKYAIHSLRAESEIPREIFDADIYFIGKTKDELSLVVPQTIAIDAEETDLNWRILEVLGPLNLTMLGIMAGISKVLAHAEVSIFVESTFETDYVLVKQENLDKAIQALSDDGYTLRLEKVNT
ncbi:ACT domain-containing protein [Agaribacter marinus]|uniref:Amino acid-binding protein n=1 Tax=Agaribacter marinus TaxID=1431249 RepID=A0AA37SWZ2_9ALTE|nr:ACT domain-containing protein [Agaribacter marinus]GLR70214.1 amino acid-binding protein [Agaribacter marinus]